MKFIKYIVIATIFAPIATFAACVPLLPAPVIHHSHYNANVLLGIFATHTTFGTGSAGASNSTYQSNN